MSIAATEPNKTRVVIVGAGFAGLYAALHLDRTIAKDPGVEVVLVDQQNFTLFTPMLHEVASGDLEPGTIVVPIRKVLRRARFVEADAESIDLAAKTLTISYGIPRRRQTLAYDHLVLAAGSETRFPAGTAIAENAIPMRTIGDAIFLRNRMIALLERAEIEPDEKVRRTILTFVIAGGGFSGVETAGAINDFLRDTVRYYPHVPRGEIRLILAHPGAVVLPEFDESLGRYTQEKLTEAGIDVRLHTRIDDFDGRTVKFQGGEAIPAVTLIWTAGVMPAHFIETLPLKKERGRVAVEPTMRHAEHPEIWAAGDCANIPNPGDGGKPYPTTAQHGMREGVLLARNIAAAVRGQPEMVKPFRYKTLGQLAAIGRRRGAAMVLGMKFSGLFAWWLWRSTYLAKLPGLEKKIKVMSQWTLDLVFSRDIVQLITLHDAESMNRPGIPKTEKVEEPKEAELVKT